MLTGAQKTKAVIRMSVENKTKPLITATMQFMRNLGYFNYAFFSTLSAIIGNFATFEGDPLTLQMRSVSLATLRFQF